jgi:hypothetical protein
MLAEGVRKLLQAAIEDEVTAYLSKAKVIDKPSLENAV